MVAGILGQKLGMTQVFSDDGTVTPATVIKAGPCVVVQRKTVERDGYDAVQLGLVEGKPAAVNKPTAGHYKKANVPPTRLRREVPLVAGSDPPAEGEQVVASLFADGDRVDVIGVSRGKGFQGVMKRHGFGGGRHSTVATSTSKRVGLRFERRRQGLSVSTAWRSCGAAPRAAIAS